jgi:hypothetical protein
MPSGPNEKPEDAGLMADAVRRGPCAEPLRSCGVGASDVLQSYTREDARIDANVCTPLSAQTSRSEPEAQSPVAQDLLVTG